MNAPGKIQQRRVALIQSAGQTFLRHGYDCSMDVIAEEAGVSRRTLFYAFKSKDQLFLAVVENSMDVEALVLPLNPDRDIEQMLLKFGQQYADQACAPAIIAVRRLLQSEALRFPETIGRIADRYFDRLLPPVADYFARLIDREMLAAAEPIFLAEQFLAAIVGFDRMRALLGGTRRSAAQRRAYIEAAVRQFLAGALKR
jgi:TetR/AcrR family transcriptional repressor of mexJK operon